jgi:tetratricopeptide (TPR) repeat protein
VAKADHCFKEAIAIQKELHAKYPAERNYRQALGKSYQSLSGIQLQAGQLKQSERSLESAFEIQAELCREFPSEADYLFDLAKSYHNQGNLICRQKSPKESESSYGTAIKHFENLASRFPSQSAYVLALLTSRNNLAMSMAENRGYTEAEKLYRLNLKICEESLNREPASTEFQSKLALTCGNLGAALADLGNYSEAMVVWNRGVEIDEKLLSDQLESPFRHYALADLLFDMGQAALKNARLAEARPLLERSLPHSRTAIKLAPARQEMVSLHCNSCAALAQTLLRLGLYNEAARVAVEPCWVSPDSTEERVRSASALAQCVSLAVQDPRLTPAQRLESARLYGDQAVSLLREAVAKNYRDAGFLERDTSFDSLRKRADFQKILHELHNGVR